MKPDDNGKPAVVSPVTGKPTGTISNPTKQVPKPSRRGVSGDVTEKHSLVINGVHITANADGSFDLPGGLHVPRGATIFPGGLNVGGRDEISYLFRNGTIVERRAARGAGIDFGSSKTNKQTGGSTWKPVTVHGTQFVERPLGTGVTPTGGSTGGTSPTGGGRPANDHALVSGGPFWGNPDDANYQQQNIVTVHTDGLSFQVNKAIATQAAGFIHDLVLAGYHPHSVQGFNNRAITGGTGKSNHAYGAAFDIDPGDNPRFVGSGGKHKIDDNTARTLAAKWGFNWGGDYKSSKDYMHFEALGAPRTPGSPAGGTAPVITPAARAAGATGASGALASTDTTSPTGTGGGVGAGTSAPSGAAPADTTAPPVLPKNASPTEIYNYVARYYPDIIPYLHDKEIGPILLQAAQGGWSDDRLQGALSKTKFWRTTAASQRAWDLQTRTDHATQSLTVDNQKQDLISQAQKLGFDLDPLVAHDLAVKGLRNGWSSSQFEDAIKTHGKVAPKQNATNVAGLRTAAQQWMVPMSDAALNKWSADLQAGRVTQDDFDTYLKEQAKSLFPSLAGAIDRGVTVQQYTDPYRQTAAQILETDPTQVDLLHDPKFSKALFNTDPKTGERTQMSLSDWQNYLRSTPEFDKTAGAVDQAARFADTITTTLGKVAA